MESKFPKNGRFCPQTSKMNVLIKMLSSIAIYAAISLICSFQIEESRNAAVNGSSVQRSTIVANQ